MRKSQAFLETVIIFVVGLSLFFGIMGMWLWGNKRLARRQPPYNNTRVLAGRLDTQDDDKPIMWPLTESVTEPGYIYNSSYEPQEITESEVFAVQR
tara:strand:+ start:456 stop:743 length:288 start_codon:yes stop_codon:yes gene_type:complete